MPALMFESENCSRCNGTGKFSRCQKYADVCLKCAGNGSLLTMRGQASQVFFNEMRTIHHSKIKADSYIIVNGKAKKVLENDGCYLDLQDSSYMLSANTTFTVALSADSKAKNDFIHESLPVDVDVHRVFARITMPENHVYS